MALDAAVSGKPGVVDITTPGVKEGTLVTVDTPARGAVPTPRLDQVLLVPGNTRDSTGTLDPSTEVLAPDVTVAPDITEPLAWHPPVH